MTARTRNEHRVVSDVMCAPVDSGIVEGMSALNDGLTYAGTDVALSDAIEKATTISVKDGGWIHGNMVLNPNRFQEWGLMPAGAMQPVAWIWDDRLGPPAPCDFPNHKSAMMHAGQLASQLDEAAAMGMIEYYNPLVHGPQQKFVQNILPLGAQAKSNGKVRMLVDPTLPGVNQHMVSLPCNLPSVEEIFKHVKPHSVLGKRDLLNGFYHLVLSHESRRFMGFRHPTSNEIGRWIVLPQGTKQSPAFFCEVSSAAATIFGRLFAANNINAIIFVYVDDFIIIADTHTDMIRAFEEMDKEAAKLGLVFNPDKDVGRTEPLTSIEALGIIIDAEKQELRLPESKRASYLAEVNTFICTYSNKECAPRKTVESLVGKLLYACRVCRWGYLYVQSILDQLYPTAGPSSAVQLNEAFWWDLKFWQQILDGAKGLWPGVRKHMIGTKDLHVNPANFSTHMFTDASKTYGLGGVLGGETYSVTWAADQRDVHIGTLELRALAECLKHWKHSLAQKTVLAWMDNTQAVSAVNKGASRIPALREILLDIALLGAEYGFEVKAKHIPGELNPADAPSRGKKLPNGQDWTFAHFTRFNTPQAEVDCCAVAQAAAADHVQTYPGCSSWFTADMLSQDDVVKSLAGKVLWATVPFSQTDSVIEAVVKAWKLDPINTQATIVLPEWENANWYRKYMRRKRPLFEILHRYAIGEHVFNWKHTSAKAPATKFPVLVIRIGSRKVR